MRMREKDISFKLLVFFSPTVSLTVGRYTL
jgi:hypothetical protein